MPKFLSDAQLADYNEHGFVAPIDIFTPAEATALRDQLTQDEAQWPDKLVGADRNNAHYVLPVLDQITHDSRILDAVEDIIGPNILVAGTTLFIKDPETSGFISWHQDARYIGLEPHDWVTGWVALSDVNLDNGCMQMVPGTHKAPLIDHIDTYDKENLLTRGQTVPDVDEDAVVPVIMKAGQLSLHHPRIVHGSGPNLSQHRRIGFAIQSYIAPNVEEVLGDIWVQLARGHDAFGHHELADRPTIPMAPDMLSFRQMANDKLSEIFYAGAAKKGKF